MKFRPDQLIAVILIVGAFVLLALGIDGEVKAIITMAAGWSFGSHYAEKKS